MKTNSTNTKAPALMILGTTSNAGKSILTTAFCRILTRRGFSVAPFKAQNMSLNSFVTHDNKEMGRAQVVQAQACRLAPDVRMNPVLLKPTSTTGSQIVVMGKPVGSMTIHEYTKYKKELRLIVQKTYDDLSSENDIIVLEGAGSPAEINLKADDIVNMSMARHAQARVLLCGDIDRGGVYAHFIGTMMCLEPEEQSLVKGFLVNRFRGDASLLSPAHDFVLTKTGKPVLGVIPYLQNLAIPDEDSVTFKNNRASRQASSADSITIALIDLPHISNATDIDPFYAEPDVNVLTAREPSDLEDADVVIIPGSKNVISDFQFLMTKGFDTKTQQLADSKKICIVGICGGYQMLGNSIKDPYSIENRCASEIRGLQLLDISTSLEKDKQLQLSKVIDRHSGCTINGYEIHHGQTTNGEHSIPFMFNTESGEPTGSCSTDSKIWGTYLHGLFDNDSFRRYFIDQIRISKNLSPLLKVQASYDIDSAIDRLADIVEKSVDIKTIYTMLGIIKC
jgi:cobyric acid synthase CobQ